MKRLYIIIALLFAVTGCSKEKTIVKENNDNEIIIENNSNMELAILYNGSRFSIPSNIIITTSFNGAFTCKNSKSEVKVLPNTKTIIINQDGGIETK